MNYFFLKPIQIRYMSGGTECATIEQLLHNFSPIEVMISLPELKRWLRQIESRSSLKKEEINTIIDGLQQEEEISCSSPCSLFILYELFFSNYNKNIGIKSLEDLFYNWNKLDTNEYKINLKLLKECIENQIWKETFFFNVAEKEVEDKRLEDNAIDENSFLGIYEKYLGKDFIKKIGEDLISIYLFLAKEERFKKNFCFLDGKIRETEWDSEFFLRLIPRLFSSSTKNDKGLPTFENYNNLEISVLSEKEFYELYIFFIGKKMHDEGVESVDGLFIMLLKGKVVDNLNVFRDVLKKSEWSVNVVENTMPRLLGQIHKNQSNTINCGSLTFSDMTCNKLFETYRYFMQYYFVINNIENMCNLYLSLQHDNYVLFSQLHKEISSTNWGTDFFNEIINKLYDDYRRVVNINDKKEEYEIEEDLAFAFFKKYYDKYISNKYIKSIKKLYICWLADHNYKNGKSFALLNSILMQNCWGVQIFLNLFNLKREIYKTEEWANILRDLTIKPKESSQIYRIGKIFIDELSLPEEGLALMRESRDLGDKNADYYLRDYLKVSDSFKKNYSSFVNKIICGQEVMPPHTCHDKCIHITCRLIHQILGKEDDYDSNAYNKLCKFINGIRSLKSDTLFNSLYPYDLSPEEFLELFGDSDECFFSFQDIRFDDLAKYHGFLYIEIRFIVGLLCRFTEDVRSIEKGNAILRTMESMYPPALYVLDNNKGASQMTKELVRKLNENLDEGLNYFCSNMVYFED